MSQKIFDESYDACVICSTLNQIVNYIPLKCIIGDGEKKKTEKIGEIINITMRANEEKVPGFNGEKESRFKRFDNKEWDKNLKNIFDEKEVNIPIDQKKANCICLDRKLNFEEMKGKITKSVRDKKKVLWNLTGGQRSTIMAIQEVIRKRAQEKQYDDTIIYLEGNTNKLIVGKYGNGELNYEEAEDNYGIDCLEIEIALALAGFKTISSKKVENAKDEDGNLFLGKIDELIVSEKVYEQENYKKILKDFVELNKGEYFNSKDYNKENGLNGKEKLSKKERMKKFKEYINDKEIVKIFDEDKQEEVKKYLTGNFGYQARPFGYILEEIVGYKLKKIIEDFNKKHNKFITDFRTNCKINFLDEDNKEQIDELDMVLLTRSGQFVIFECKSGTMSGDNAKSNKYTTYSIGSVYGKPILITPFTKKLKENSINEKEYKPIKTALNSAERAKMEVWGIDELRARLEDLFSDAILSEEGENV